MTKDELKQIITDGLTSVASGHNYRKITFRNGNVKLTKPYRSKKAKKLLDKFLEENQ